MLIVALLFREERVWRASCWSCSQGRRSGAVRNSGAGQAARAALEEAKTAAKALGLQIRGYEIKNAGVSSAPSTI
jgi:hypothetical protein